MGEVAEADVGKEITAKRWSSRSNDFEGIAFEGIATGVERTQCYEAQPNSSLSNVSDVSC